MPDQNPPPDGAPDTGPFHHHHTQTVVWESHQFDTMQQIIQQPRSIAISNRTLSATQLAFDAAFKKVLDGMRLPDTREDLLRPVDTSRGVIQLPSVMRDGNRLALALSPEDADYVEAHLAYGRVYTKTGVFEWDMRKQGLLLPQTVAAIDRIARFEVLDAAKLPLVITGGEVPPPGRK